MVALPHQELVVEVGLLEPEKKISIFMINIMKREDIRRFHLGVTVYLLAINFPQFKYCGNSNVLLPE